MSPTLARFVPVFLFAACSSISNRPAGSLPIDANFVQIRAEMADLAEPGLEHADLKKRVGNWDISMKWRQGNSGEWQQDRGASTIRLALNGRYLVEEVKGTLAGRPFEGYGVMGYSNLEGNYFSIWMDSLTTWPLGARGERGADGVLRFTGRVRDVVTPAGRPYHIDETEISDNEYLREVYDTIGGEPVKIMETRRTRRR